MRKVTILLNRIQVLVLFACFSFSFLFTQGQISINPMGNPPDNSAALDVQFTDKGLLIPRMTTAQRNAISNPAHSLLIFNTTTNCFEWWNSTVSQWLSICGCLFPSAPTANAASGITMTAFVANWSAVSGATGYLLDVATDNTFTNFASGYNNLSVGNVTSYNVTGLACNTQYFYRVRAVNSCGTSAISNTIAVTTSECPPSCDTQVWMAANMDVGTMVIGSLNHSNDGVLEKYCYNNNLANCAMYGGLYQWAEAMQLPYSNNSFQISPTPSWQTCDPCGSSGRQGICPAGYHIPTDLEWSRYEWCIETTISPTGSTPLSTFQNNSGWRGTNSNAGPGAKMKVTSSHTPSWDGNNASGFTALPAGHRHTDGSFYEMSSLAFYSSASEYDVSYVWFRGLYSGYSQSIRNAYYKLNGFSVRCLQN